MAGITPTTLLSFGPGVDQIALGAIAGTAEERTSTIMNMSNNMLFLRENNTAAPSANFIPPFTTMRYTDKFDSDDEAWLFAEGNGEFAVQVDGPGGSTTVEKIFQPFQMQEQTFTTLTMPFSESDFTAGAITEAINIIGATGAALPFAAFLNVESEFEGGGTASATLMVGDAADPDGIMEPIDVWTGSGGGFISSGITGADTMVPKDPWVPQILLTVDGAHVVSDLTAGTATVTLVFMEI
jgi:hypothetical protein